MATKEQYEFFRRLYEEEERTYEQIEGRAKVFLSIITAFIVTVVLKSEDAVKSAAALRVPWFIYLLMGAILALALVFVVLSVRIRAYEALVDPEALIESYEGDGPTDEIFFEDRIADYAVAASRNRAENNRAASILAWAGWLLVSAMVLMVLTLLLALRGMP